MSRVTPIEPWTLGALPWEMREIHPLAAIFPPLDDTAFKALAADIRRRGLIVPILLDPEGRVLDGRARLAACHSAGREPRFHGTDEDPLTAIIVRNGQRRQLTQGQRALAAARALPHLQASLRKRKRGLKRKGDFEESSDLTGGRADLRRTVARQFGIATGTLSHAKRVIERDIPALIKAVEDGRIKISRAAWLARHSPEFIAQALWERNKAALPKVRPMPRLPPRHPGVIQVPRLNWGDPHERLVDAIRTLAALSRMSEAYELARDFPLATMWDAEIGGKRALAFLDCFMRHWHHHVIRAGGIRTPDMPG